MGFAILIHQGIQGLKSELPRLEAQVGGTRAAAAFAALEKLPQVLEGLNALAWRERAEPRDRAALTVVVSYGLKTENRLPAVGERILLGVIDDAYLAFFAATLVHEGLPGISPADLRKGAAALAEVLPKDIVSALERDLMSALDEIEAFTKGAS